MSKRKKSSNNNIQTGQARSATSVPLKLSLSVPAGAAIIVLATFLAYLPSINGGFVFDSIHNVQARTPIANVVAMIEAVHEFNGIE